MTGQAIVTKMGGGMPHGAGYFRAECRTCRWTERFPYGAAGGDEPAARVQATDAARTHDETVHGQDAEPSIASLTDWLNRTTFSPEDAEVLRRIIAERTVEREFEAHVRIRGTSIEVGMMTPAGAGEIDARTFANRVLGRSERVLTMEPGGATGVWRGEIIEGDA